jgi:hypothetical protein
MVLCFALVQQRRSQVRLPCEFRALARDLRTIVALLNDYLRDTDTDVPGTMAAAEHDDEPTYADDQVTDPVLHVQVRAHHSLIAAIDHLGGVAACIAAENVTLAAISLLRPTVVAAGVNYWLLDPGISLRERLRRGWNLELDSIRQQMNSISKAENPQFWEDLAISRHRYLSWAEAHGYQRQVRKERYGERRYWLTDGTETAPPLAEIKLAEAVLSAVGDGGMGKQAYQFTSSFIHTQPHAFSMFLPAYMQTDSQTPGVVPLGVAIDDMTTWMMVATLAVHTAAARCGYYFGWDLTKWVKVVNAIMSKWTDTLHP